MIPPSGAANVTCFNCERMEHLRRDHPFNQSVGDAVCDCFSNRSSAVQIGHELLSSMEYEEQHHSGPVKTNFTDQTSIFENLFASSKDKVNDLEDDVEAVEEGNMKNHVLTHLVPPNVRNVVHPLSGQDLGL